MPIGSDRLFYLIGERHGGLPRPSMDIFHVYGIIVLSSLSGATHDLHTPRGRRVLPRIGGVIELAWGKDRRENAQQYVESKTID